MLEYPLFEVTGQANVGFVWCGLVADEVDVMHDEGPKERG